MTTLEPGSRILLIGGDARTDAIAEACAASALAPELFAYSKLRNPGLVARCTHVETGSLADVDAIARYAATVGPALVIVGPEEPLALGVVDKLEELGIPCFGPSASSAQVEASKAWTRRLVEEHAIPGNPQYRRFDTTDGLLDYLGELGDFVVKPDGLTGGKGVRVLGEHLHSLEEAYEYAAAIVADGSTVVIEERLVGEEFSLQSITDGASVVHCPPVQDHKRSDEGDNGPNTGGMGSYSDADHSLPFLDPADVEAAQQINEAVVRALQAETGRPYRGVLYGGFIATHDGVRLIEYNCRFGDPEAMNVLPLLQTDLLEVCWAVTQGTLGDLSVTFDAKATVCKYVVPETYPTAGGAGEEVRVPDGLRVDTDVRVYWAATELDGDRVLLTDSRAVAVVGIGASLDEAEQLAEEAASVVEGPVRHRSDIGKAAIVERRVRHMAELRDRG